MTRGQQESWESDVNVYVADEEDDMFSVRTSGELVLEELLRNADGAAGIFAAAVRRRLDEAAAAKVCMWSHIMSSPASEGALIWLVLQAPPSALHGDPF